MADRVWNEERSALLRELCAPGSTMSTAEMAAVIGERFSVKVSRDSVRSKAIRMGLQIPRKPNSPSGRPKRRVIAVAGIKIRPRPSLFADAPLPSKREQHIDEPDGLAGVYFINSARTDCKRPISGSGLHMRVCGEPTKPGQSYCEHCMQRVFTKEALWGQKI